MSESKAISRWFRDLPETKRLAIRRLHRTKPVYNVIAILHVGVWTGTASLMHAFPAWPLRIAGYILIGFLMHGLANLMHEGIHGNVFRRRLPDQWFSFFVSAPVFVSASAYRVVHLMHHRYNRTAHDPDEITNVTAHRDLLRIVFYAWGCIGMFFYVLVRLPAKALHLSNYEERRQILTEYALLLIVYTGLVLAATTYGFLDGLLHYWIFPGLFTGLFANVRGWAEHMMTEPGHPLTQTRTVTSNKLFSLLNVNLNYHLEHHLFPAIPWYHLPKVHQLLRDEYRRIGAFVEPSYTRFFFNAIRVGIEGTTQRLEPGPAHRADTTLRRANSLPPD